MHKIKLNSSKNALEEQKEKKLSGVTYVLRKIIKVTF